MGVGELKEAICVNYIKTCPRFAEFDILRMSNNKVHMKFFIKYLIILMGSPLKLLEVDLNVSLLSKFSFTANHFC